MSRSAIIGGSAAAVLVVGYVGASWGFGRMVHSGFDSWEQQLATQPLPMLKIAERKYTPGVFSSVEDVTFEVNGGFFDQLMKSRQPEQQASDTQQPPMRFTVRNEVQHGPFPGFTGVGMGRIDTKLVWSKEFRERLDKFLPGREPVEISTQLALFGGADSHVTSPAFDVRDGKATLLWQGLDGHFSVGRNLGTIGCDATAPGLSVHAASGAGVKLETLKLTCDGVRVFDALYTGTVNVDIANIEGGAKDGTSALRAQKVSYSSDVRADGEYLDMAAKVGIGAFDFMQYGLSDIKYDVSLRHLHGPTYAALSRKMQSTAMSSMGGDPTASLALMGALAEFGPQLLEHAPQLVIDHIGFTAPEGEFGIKGTVELPGFVKDDLATPQSRAALVGKVVANADVWVSEELLNKDWSSRGQNAAVADEAVRAPSPAADAQSPGKVEALRQQVAAFEQQGFVTRKDGELHTHIEFKKGTFTANGKPLR